MFTSRTIIVGVDGLAPCGEVVAFAARLASGDGTLVLASVYPYGLFPGRTTDTQFHAELRTRARQALARMSAYAEGAGQVDTVPLADPSAAHALQELAVERKAAVIVLGPSHVGRFGRVVPGSTAERVLHGAPCAVAILPAGTKSHRGRLDTIGVAVNGSAESLEALHAAAATSRAHDAELQVIAVCDAHEFATPASQIGPGFYIDHEARDRRAREQLDAAVAQVPAGIRVTPVFLSGKPAEQLVAASAGLDLLFLGSRGYGPMHAVLVGGVSGQVVRDAACPLLVTPPGAAVEAATSALATAETA